MPIVPTSPSTRTHSWLDVYFRSSEFTHGPPHVSRRRPLVERRRHDARGGRAAANVHLELGPDRGGARRQQREPDRLSERRRVRPRRHDARTRGGLRRIAVARDPAVHGYAAKTAAGPGVVTSGTHSPTLGKPIGLALLPARSAAVGTEFEVDIRGRAAAARVVPTPFYKRPSS